jgi:hypothetical protein
MFLKWVVVGRVKVGDLPTPPENSEEGILDDLLKRDQFSSHAAVER